MDISWSVKYALWVSLMANVFDSAVSSPDLLHCVVFWATVVISWNTVVKSFIPVTLFISFFHRVQLLANVPRTDFSANTLVLSYRSGETYKHAITEISFTEFV